MNRREILLTAGAMSALGLAGCKPAGGGANLAARKYGTWGFDPAGMDKSVGPGDDFFRYSAGKAFDALKIPADRASWGPAEELSELSNARNRAIMGATNPANAAEGTLRKLYAASVGENAVHGSDSPTSAAREVSYFFRAIELS